MTERESCLNNAKSMVCGEREQDYGTPEDNFAVIARLWNGYLNNSRSVSIINGTVRTSITPKDVAMMMCLLKIARIATGTGTGDSFIDLAGYAACGYEIRMNEPFNSSEEDKDKSVN